MPIHLRARRPAAKAAPAARQEVVPGARVASVLPPVPADIPQRPAGVTLCMIVKNEEKFLPQCLASVRDYVDEIVVVDTGSTDRTIEIARSYGAVVVEDPWRNDFSWSRNMSIEHATRRWILFMDADEELAEESRASLLALKNAPAHLTGIFARIINKTDDYRGSGDVSHHVIRIFPNNERVRFYGPIHEYPALDGTSTTIDAVSSALTIVHHGYVNTIVNERNKGRRNMEILLAATQNDPDNPYHWYNLGTTSYLVKDFELTRSALEKMYALVGEQPRAFMPNGLALLSDLYCDHFGDPVKGEEFARQSLRRSAHYANAHLVLGKCLVAQKRFDEAREAFREAIADGAYVKQQFMVDDQVPIWKAHSEIASSYAIQGDDLKALEWCEAGLKNAPNVEVLMLNHAKGFERLQRFAEAERAYRLALETHESIAAMLHYVNFILRRGRAAEALALVETWHARLPASQAAELLTSSAGVSWKHGLGREREFLELALAYDPDSEKVRTEYQRILGKAPFVENPVTAAEWRARADRALGEKHGEAALAACDAALALEPRDVDLLLTRAAALELLASPAGVEASLLRAREVDRTRASVALSLFYLRSERYAEAAAVADAALK